MKRLADYNITEEEIKHIFGGQKEYEAVLEYIELYFDRNYEKVHIAYLLFIRGDREESRKILENVKDGPVGHLYIRYYDWWEDEAAGDDAPKRDDD